MSFESVYGRRAFDEMSAAEAEKDDIYFRSSVPEVLHWVRVKDEYPPGGEVVLVCTTDRDHSVTAWSNGKDWFNYFGQVTGVIAWARRPRGITS